MYICIRRDRKKERGKRERGSERMCGEGEEKGEREGGKRGAGGPPNNFLHDFAPSQLYH